MYKTPNKVCMYVCMYVCMHPSEDSSSTISKQFPLRQIHFTGLSTQNVHHGVLLYAVSSILMFKFPSQRIIFPCLPLIFLRPIVHPWTAHFYRNDLPLLEINKCCVLSVLRQVLMFSQYWYIPICLCLFYKGFETTLKCQGGRDLPCKSLSVSKKGT